MANILSITAADSGTTFPLRGNMSVAMNFTPDQHFVVKFVTRTADMFTFNSTTHLFSANQATPSANFTFGGEIGLFVTFMFDVNANNWVLTENNTAGSGGSGGVISNSELVVNAVPTVPVLDGSLNSSFFILLNSDQTMPSMINLQPGTQYTFVIQQDIVGGWTLKWPSNMKFFGGASPTLSTNPLMIDMIVAHCTQNNYLLANAYLGISTAPIAQIGATLYSSMSLAVAAATPGQTIKVLRSGLESESTAAMTQTGQFTVQGLGTYVPGKAGSLTTLAVTHGFHLAYSKAILDVETGDVTVKNVAFNGASYDPDCNGAAIRFNPAATHLLVNNIYVTNCEDGILAAQPNVPAAAGSFHVEIIDSTLDANGFAVTDPARQGFSHNFYANTNPGGACSIHSLRSYFINAVEGHDFKTRATYNLIDRIHCNGSLAGRELDVSNGGILHASDCYFIKPNSNTQGNLVGIAWEYVLDNRPLEYVFRNCLFYNFRSVNYQNTWVTQADTTAGYQSNGRTDNGTTTIYFIDCVFLGDPVNCTIGSADIQIVWTGGPIGPSDYVAGSMGTPVMQPIQSVYDRPSATYKYNAPGVYNRPVINGPDPTLTMFPPTGSSPTQP